MAGGTWPAMGIDAFAFMADYLMLMLFVAVPIAIARDMRRRGCKGWTYGLLTLVLFPLGVSAWLVDRNRFPRSQ